MTLPTLPEKWGSKEIWLRAFLVRFGLIWLFRAEFREFELGTLTWLNSVLEEAYRIANAEAARFDDHQAAFSRAVELVKGELDDRIASHGDDAELQRLRRLVDVVCTSDPVQQIFDALARNTKTIYRPSQRRTTVLRIEWLNDHPRAARQLIVYPDPYHVNAETRIVGETASVELQIYLDLFDVNSLLAVPAILTHELVCHAHAREDRNDDRSWWAEGVMDWVAWQFFETWVVPLARLGLPSGATKRAGERLRDARMTRARLGGWSAAEALVDWLVTDRSVRRTSVAQSLTAKLALQVNVVRAPLLDKDTLASRLANIQRDPGLQNAVQAWHHDGKPVADLLA